MLTNKGTFNSSISGRCYLRERGLNLPKSQRFYNNNKATQKVKLNTDNSSATKPEDMMVVNEPTFFTSRQGYNFAHPQTLTSSSLSIFPSFVSGYTNKKCGIDTTLDRSNDCDLKRKSSLKRKVTFQERDENEEKRPRMSPRKDQHVSFAEYIKIRRFHFDISDHVDKQDLWYCPQEIEKFRRSARKIIEYLRENDCDDIEYRGLESRICEERLAFRQIATRTVLKCQKYLSEKRLRNSNALESKSNFDTKEQSDRSNAARLRDDSKLASVTEKCTRWAKKIALHAAEKDYIDVYGKP